ncbi:hypothetical protein RND71_014069 [Anisodus tanguticus]|uniref:Cyclin-dependent kinase inhibitor n=1 Tax=Anisodus tanguticus TaxID=243964 RepID=A0AAE1VME7_9SOLA|nr:hypothetical protein RND71_014069 [Anisodus tanguticus]
MGKYLRKAKITGDVAVMDVSQSTLGVRTRARTLALQRLQSSSTTTPPPSSSSSSSSDTSYLQLRSRRLEKPKNPKTERCSVKLGSIRVTEDVNDFGHEISFGENSFDFEPRDREADALVNPGSATRRTELNATAQRTRNSILRNIPSAHEIEEFFTFSEQQQQRLFMEKYNFDVANDLPLSGRYEWIRVNH